MSELDIGILALQGDVAENFVSTMMAMNELGIDGSVSQVKTPDQISAVDGLIVPGGESTMMGQLSMVNGAMNALKEKIGSGMPVLGICAGMILLAKNSKDRVVGSGIFKAEDAMERARAVVLATTFWEDADAVKEAQKMINEKQSILGLDVKNLELRMQERGGSS